MNIAILKGRLTDNPVIRGEGDKKVARYTIACDRWKDGADFPTCVAFGRSADFVEKYLSKGKEILVEGKITTGSYEKDGKKVYTTEVTVYSHEFCGKADSKEKENTPEKMPEFLAVPEGLENELPFGKQ